MSDTPSAEERAEQVAAYTKAHADGWFYTDVRDAALRHIQAAADIREAEVRAEYGYVGAHVRSYTRATPRVVFDEDPQEVKERAVIEAAEAWRDEQGPKDSWASRTRTLIDAVDTHRAAKEKT